MNYEKINLELKQRNLIDDRNISCHVYNKYTTSKDYGAFAKFTTIKNDYYLPNFMILSIKDDYLFISYANISGGFKKYYACFKLSNLKLKRMDKVDAVMRVYVFDILDDLVRKNREFIFIAINKNIEKVEKLVSEISKAII